MSGVCVCVCVCVCRGGSRGGVSGVATPPPNGQSYNIKCSSTDVLSHGDALNYLAKRMVVVVAKF